MKVVRTEMNGGYQIIRGIENPAPDPAATENEAFRHVTVAEYKTMSQEKIQELFNQHIMYSNLGPNARFVEDDEAGIILSKLTSLNEHEKLQANLEILPDWQGTEFWLKVNGIWGKQKIDCIGVMPPDGFILPDNLTEEYHREIAAQEEVNRLINLTAEQREEEKESALTALKVEALRQRDMAELVEEQFDAKAWYQAEAAKINAKYAGL
jgi:hypothetical protein